jgi:FixJ family two-component response regulator
MSTRRPRATATELARRVRAMRPGLPVLFISGLSDEAVATIEPGGPPVPVLEKPFDASALGQALRRVLGEGS